MQSFSIEAKKDTNFRTQIEEQQVTNFSGGRESTSTESIHDVDPNTNCSYSFSAN